jgi:hypothetical protein
MINILHYAASDAPGAISCLSWQAAQAADDCERACGAHDDLKQWEDDCGPLPSALLREGYHIVVNIACRTQTEAMEFYT